MTGGKANGFCQLARNPTLESLVTDSLFLYKEIVQCENYLVKRFEIGGRSSDIIRNRENIEENRTVKMKHKCLHTARKSPGML
jgi:hypothetical protein